MRETMKGAIAATNRSVSGAAAGHGKRRLSGRADSTEIANGRPAAQRTPWRRLARLNLLWTPATGCRSSGADEQLQGSVEVLGGHALEARAGVALQAADGKARQHRSLRIGVDRRRAGAGGFGR